MTVQDSHQANFIAGKWVRSDQLIDNIDPATGETFAQVCLARVTDVEIAVTVGQKAIDAGLVADMAPVELCRILLRIATELAAL